MGALGSDVDRLFGQDVEPAPRRGDAVSRVQSRRAADSHKMHWTVSQKLGQVRVRLSTMLVAQPSDLPRVCSIDGGNLDSREGTGRPRVGLGNISAADQSDVSSHRVCWVPPKARFGICHYQGDVHLLQGCELKARLPLAEPIDRNPSTVYHPLFASRPCSTKPSPTTTSCGSLAAAVLVSSTKAETTNSDRPSPLNSPPNTPPPIRKLSRPS